MPTQRLELTWIGKNNPEYDIAYIEPRILIEVTFIDAVNLVMNLVHPKK